MSTVTIPNPQGYGYITVPEGTAMAMGYSQAQVEALPAGVTYQSAVKEIAATDPVARQYFSSLGHTFIEPVIKAYSPDISSTLTMPAPMTYTPGEVAGKYTETDEIVESGIPGVTEIWGLLLTLGASAGFVYTASKIVGQVWDIYTAISGNKTGTFYVAGQQQTEGGYLNEW